MAEELIEQISDTEAVVEGAGPTRNYFSHVFRAALRTEDDWKQCCKADSIEAIHACPKYDKGLNG